MYCLVTGLYEGSNKLVVVSPHRPVHNNTWPYRQIYSDDQLVPQVQLLRLTLLKLLGLGRVEFRVYGQVLRV